MFFKRAFPGGHLKRTQNFDKNRRITTIYDSPESSPNEDQAFKFPVKLEKAPLVKTEKPEDFKVVRFQAVGQTLLNTPSNRNMNMKSPKHTYDLNNNDDLVAASNNFMNEMSVYKRERLKRRSKENRRESFDANRNNLASSTTVSENVARELMFPAPSCLDFSISETSRVQFEELLDSRTLESPDEVIKSDPEDELRHRANYVVSSNTFTINNRVIPNIDRMSEIVRTAKRQMDLNESLALEIVRGNDNCSWSMILSLSLFMFSLSVIAIFYLNSKA
jgi:hypothetical protein